MGTWGVDCAGTIRSPAVCMGGWVGGALRGPHANIRGATRVNMGIMPATVLWMGGE